MPATRRPTSMTLDAALLDDARALGINISRAAEAGILAQIRMERARRWKEDNAADIAAYNNWIEENGVPLSRYRKFRWPVSSTSIACRKGSMSLSCNQTSSMP